MKNLLTIICFFIFGLTGCVKQSLPIGGNNANSIPDERKLFSSDFIGLCNGGKIGEAARYDKTPNTTSPVAVYFQADPDQRFEEPFLTDHSIDWIVNYTNAEKTQLVACISVSEKKEARKCSYKVDGKNYQLTMNDAKYHVSVYEAKTGTIVTEKDLDLKSSKSCPVFEWFTDQEKTEEPDYKQSVINFLKPLVKH